MRWFLRGDQQGQPAPPLTAVRLWTPLYQHAAFLILNTILVSAGGVLFWWVAARFATPSDVGLTAGMISSLTLLVTIGNLGLGFGLVRFMPMQHDGGRVLVESATTVVLVVALVCAGVFLIGIRLWAPALTTVQDNLLSAGLFAFTTSLAAAAVLQDNTFLAKRATHLIVIKNSALNATRLVCIPILVTAGALGIFGALAAGFAVSFAVAYALLLPRMCGLPVSLGRVSWPLLREIFPYSLTNLLADLVVVAPSIFLPLIVLHLLGAAATAYFYVAWLAAGFLMVIPNAFAQALFTEGAHAEGDLGDHVLHAARGVAFVLGVFVAGTLLVAGWALALFGRAYAAEGAGVLRLLALAAVPASASSLAFAVLRVRRAMRLVIAGQLCLAVCTLIFAWSFGRAYGVIGVGGGWLVANAIAALVVTPVALHLVRTTGGSVTPLLNG